MLLHLVTDQVIDRQTCRKSAVPQSDRSFCEKDQLNIGSYRSECPTRFFFKSFIRSGCEYSYMDGKMAASWPIQFKEGMRQKIMVTEHDKKKKKLRKYIILNGLVQLINSLMPGYRIFI
jgi:hypothetical protein